MTESEWFEQLFNRLSHSKFRSSFHLINDNLNMYINDHLRMYTSDYALI